ncbi:OB-fold domain-containing protein, partial [Mycobacterium sp. UM_CSW]|uniref:OB-fold domain-containing protein n=1 Tax=Mycobacterium sp. UM_CSW TaxID=1370119 RepID=UPI0009DBD343
MSHLTSIGTYLPPWQLGNRRAKGPDEDALTMAVAAGRAADPAATAERVVLISRDLPLLEGGNGAVLLAGLSLPETAPVTEVLGGAPAVLDQIVASGPGTLVVATDDNDSAVGAAAVLLGADEGGANVHALARRTRSLPMQARGADGVRHQYVDPRLQREVGIRSTLARLGLSASERVTVIAGAKAAELGGGIDTRGAANEPAPSASAVIRLIAEAVHESRTGVVLAVEQSSVAAAGLRLGAGDLRVSRDETPARDLPKQRTADGNGIPISLPAYARAFEPKLRWEAAIYDDMTDIDGVPLTPPRLRVDAAGQLLDYRLEKLPRTGTVYTHTTIRIPVPDLPSPYSLAVVVLDDTAVRVLLKVTGVPAGETSIGQSGSVVLRRIATRAGIPDYGYMFWPAKALTSEPQGISMK